MREHPLKYASQSGHVETVLEMVPYSSTSDLEFALCLAASNGHVKLLAALLDIPAVSPNCVAPNNYKMNYSSSGGETALILAVSSLEPQCVKLLLEKGADVQQTTSRYLNHGYFSPEMAIKKDGQTPLHHLARIAFSRGNKSNSKEILDMLLLAGADLEARDEEGATPIMLITRSSRWGVNEPLELFLSAGADPCALDFSGDSLLHRVCEVFERTEIVRKLLAYNANPRQVRNSDGSTPLHW